MPLTKEAREKQRELKKQRKGKKRTTGGTVGGGLPFMDSSDPHCLPMSVKLKGKFDKFGNWTRG